MNADEKKMLNMDFSLSAFICVHLRFHHVHLPASAVPVPFWIAYRCSRFMRYSTPLAKTGEQ
jgi:hypothetical protein